MFLLIVEGFEATGQKIRNPKKNFFRFNVLVINVL